MTYRPKFEHAEFANGAAAAVIRALYSADGQMKPVSFATTSVSHIAGVDGDTVHIALKTGVDIYLRKSYDDVETAVYFSTGFADFSDVSVAGPAAAQLPVVFNAAAREPENMTVQAVVRKPYTKEKVMFELPAAAIDWARAEEFDSDNSSCVTTVRLRTHGVTTPFEQGEILIDGKLADVMAQYRAAQERGEKVCQLSGVAAFSVNTQINFIVFSKQADRQNFRPFSFSEKEVDWTDVEDNRDGQNGAVTKIKLKGKRTPFGSRGLILDMPHAEFMAAYKAAKLAGKTELDLRRETSGRGPALLPPGMMI